MDLKLLAAGVDLRTVAPLLGHKPLQMLLGYAHLFQSYELVAVEGLCNTGGGTENRSETTSDRSAEPGMQ